MDDMKKLTDIPSRKDKRTATKRKPILTKLKLVMGTDKINPNINGKISNTT